ncbi:MAG: GNAT family N-acetyltransferase [Oscillospiraceae bacterium]|nr:GNAT family N-acetyltransferase [Oscillospiraceae bacterium]
METAKVTLLRDNPEKTEKAAEWFHKKWGIPKEAYLESMEECVNGKTGVPQWYFIEKNDKIIAGMGVIENDFHQRKDLSPNVCAVYVEKEHRGNNTAKKLLEFVCNDLHRLGYDVLYLITSLNGFYEKCGWEYYCDVLENNGDSSKMYRHIYNE